MKTTFALIGKSPFFSL